MAVTLQDNNTALDRCTNIVKEMNALLQQAIKEKEKENKKG